MCYLGCCKKSLKTPKGGNQNPSIEKGQITHWPKVKGVKDNILKTKGRETKTQTITWVNSRTLEG